MKQPLETRPDETAQHGVDTGGVTGSVSQRNTEGDTDSSSKDLHGYRSVRQIIVSPHLPFETYISASVHRYFLVVHRYHLHKLSATALLSDIIPSN